MLTHRPGAINRYNWRVGIAMTIYVVAILGSVAAINAYDPVPLVRGLLAVITAAPVVAVFVALGAYLIEEGDEYQRMLMVRQMLIGTGLAMAFCTVWGFLESFKVAGHLPLYFAAIAWFGAFGVARLVRRFGA
jgi:hypothetical protein